MDKAAIYGSLVDVRNVNQHKCVRMLIDVPAEHAPMVMEAFGWPTMANPVPVAIARLQSQPAAQQAEKPERKWSDMPRSQQAGIACSDPDFRSYLQQIYCMAHDAADPAAAVRHLCQVKSRSELDTNRAAAGLWDKLYSDYQLWRRGAAA